MGVPARRVCVIARRSFALWLAVCCCGSALLSVGCNPGSIGYLFKAANPNYPPDEVNFTEKKSNPKVLILVTHASPQVQANTDLASADDLLALRLMQLLQKLYKDNGERVQIVPLQKVREFKAKHADCKLLPLDEIGKKLDADFVVNIEITSMSLDNSSLLYEGKATVQISVVETSDPDNGTISNKSYKCTYPDSGPVPKDDSVQLFRDKFIDRMAHDLCRWFAPYPSEFKQRFD